MIQKFKWLLRAWENKRFRTIDFPSLSILSLRRVLTMTRSSVICTIVNSLSRLIFALSQWIVRMDHKLCILCYLYYIISDIRSMSIYAMLSSIILSILYSKYTCYYAISAVSQTSVDNTCSLALHQCDQWLCYLYKRIASSIKYWLK